jgi:4-hydroxy-2-oxoheptanedioate aldolase
MLTENRLKKSLNDGKLALGLVNTLPVPVMVEMAGVAGYDFVILDPSRAGPGPESLEDLIRAAECAGLTPLVRVPLSSPDALPRALDAGAQGLLVSRVRTREEAEAVVRATRFHPHGARALSDGRLNGFGRVPPPDFMARANRQLLVGLCLEDREAVDAIDSIVTVEGLDWVMEEVPALSRSYGVPGKLDAPDVQGALRRVATACQRNGLWYCATPRLPGEAERWLREGAAALLLGDDRGVAFRALQAHVESVRLELTSE